MAIEYNDMGNGQRLAEAIEGKLMYVPELQHWYSWAGTHWKQDVGTALARYANEVSLSIVKDAKQVLEDPERSEARVNAKKIRNKQGIDAMMSIAERSVDLNISVARLDRDPMLFNCANGTYDLRKNELCPHSQSDYLTVCSPIAYKPNSSATKWKRFIQDIMCKDKDLIRFLQKTLGYAMTGSVKEQVMFILNGHGANGKSTLLEAVRYVMNAYASHTPPDILLQKSKRDSQPYIARLKGKRFVTTVETDESHMNIVTVKQLTGDDTIMAKQLYKDPFELTPTWKIFMATNSLPAINNQQNAIWRRMMAIPFDAIFKTDKIDKNLGSKLRAEGEGILAWMIEGYRMYAIEGLRPPVKVTQASSNYQQDHDPVGEYFKTKCQIQEGAVTAIQDLYDDYTQYCKATHDDILPKTTLIKSLLQKYPSLIRIRTKYDRSLRNLHLMGVFNVGTFTDEAVDMDEYDFSEEDE